MPPDIMLARHASRRRSSPNAVAGRAVNCLHTQTATGLRRPRRTHTHRRHAQTKKAVRFERPLPRIRRTPPRDSGAHAPRRLSRSISAYAL
ncbi:conserved hypothetical protein [Burkholderia mallei PRL-20]|nr:hypothetical protein BMASAVP1_1513 [Burkholderia mallei SAVP1]ABO02987.1 hypothetical protein BMA10247_A0365 [Burkholderia mallei NCTC 10247]EES45951.1 conserved hypothetical protein [Burkholderia mallei PRL-20]